MNRRGVLLVALLFLIAACGKQETPTPPPPAAGENALAAQLTPGDALPDIPADQSTPAATLNAMFAALKVALDPQFQIANRNPESSPDLARKYQEARARLRQIFVSSRANTEVVAYLDLIRVKDAKLAGSPKEDGDQAVARVKIFKGDNLKIDPQAFGEGAESEATVEVRLERVDQVWRIADFGGLVSRATADE